MEGSASSSLTSPIVAGLTIIDLQVSSEQLWTSNGYGYDACIKPTSRYKGKFSFNLRFRFLFLKINLN